MAGRGGSPTIQSGRRGYLRYLYGTHYWIPEVQDDFSAGIVRDTPRTEIPANGVYDCVDYLCHQQGALIGRGATVYAGPALTNAVYAAGVVYAEFPAGAKLIAVGSDG